MSDKLDLETEQISYFEGSPLGQLIFDRTYRRTKPNGERETWLDCVERVVEGNCSFVDQKFIEPGEKQALQDLMLRRVFMPAGRHLWTTGVEGRQFTANCHHAGWDTLADHVAFTFGELMKGGGVGSNYSSKYLEGLTPLAHKVEVSFICDDGHADFDVLRPLLSNTQEQEQKLEWEQLYRIPDSREGWVESLSKVIEASQNQKWASRIVFDVSDVRPLGSPIKGFGGTASGPLALMLLLKKVATLTGSGQVTPVLTMLIDHYIAEAVIAGNVRRSARMSILHWADPQIFWFLNCKQTDPAHHWSTNISVEIDDEFLNDLIWGNGTTQAEIVYDKILDGMLSNGEPGFYNSSLASKGEHRHLASTNPCVHPDTWTLTAKGPRRVGELVGEKCSLIVDNQLIRTTSDGFYETGVKETVKVSFKNWKTPLICTSNQKLNSKDHGWIEVENLQQGDKLRLQDHWGVQWGGNGTEDEGYLLGHLVGDGNFASNSVELKTWDADGDTSMIRSEVDRIMKGFSTRSDFSGWRRTSINTGYTLSAKAIANLAAEYGIMSTETKKVTDDIERSSSDFYVGFLRGAFDTDGHIEGGKKSGISVRLSWSDYDSLTVVQRMLGRLGIMSRIYLNKDAGYKAMPNGRGGLSEFWCRASYRLTINSFYAHRFIELIGFWHNDKIKKFYRLTEGTNPRNNPMWAEIESIIPDEPSPVYDTTVLGLVYEGQGLDVWDCGELPLEPWEFCNLGHVNLAFGKPEDHLEAFRLMARFLVRATFCDITDPKQKEVGDRNRRIGVGWFGIQQWLAKRDIPMSQFDRDNILRDNLMVWAYIVRKEADRYADELAIPRPIKTTTIAPTGTVSKLCGVSEGLQAEYARYYIRRVRYSETDPEVEQLRKRGVPLEPCIYSSGTTVASFPCRASALDYAPEHLIEEQSEIPIETLLRFQAAVQKYYVDNAISCTINVPENISANERLDLRRNIKKYLPELKGITVFPEGSRPQSPIEKLSKIQYETLIAIQDNQPIHSGTTEILEEECLGGSCPVR